METFLKDTCTSVYEKYGNFDNISFVLPSKRGGVFLKRYISEIVDTPIFSPPIYSIEELIIEISGLQKCNTINLQLALFEAYQDALKDETSFESFIPWSNSLLADFNEIDRHLVDDESLFDYLSDTKRLNKWGISEEPSPLIEDNLKFWDQLKNLYKNFTEKLQKSGLGYQGMLYRKAVEAIEGYLQKQPVKVYIFIGFNAFNTAEEKIIQSFLSKGNAEIFWDLDQLFLEDNIHEAGFFIRDYLKKWPYFNQHKPKGISGYFLEPKTIEITGVPKGVSQAKYAGKLIENRLKSDLEENIALVLAEETLLPAMLNSLPENTKKVNITMGIPLKKTNLYSFFQAVFDLHIGKTINGWYYKDVNRLLSNPYAQTLFQKEEMNWATVVTGKIKERNLFYIDAAFIKEISSGKSVILEKLFPEKNHLKPLSFIAICQEIIAVLKLKYQQSQNPFELHMLYGFFQLFNQLQSYIEAKTYLKTLKSLKLLFQELVSSEQVDFKGEPLGGIQIMGMLESRNLDFETVILTSVNEGILPAGKSYNSLIPYDIKKEYHLPTFKEKDAVFAYHFYRLLQRAKNVFIIYNTEPDVLLGNEKSRFISQLLSDPLVSKHVTHKTLSPKTHIAPIIEKKVEKTPQLQARLLEMAEHGFSPSSLTNYIKNPYSFYKQNVLKIEDVDEVEENIAHNTFGTIVHDTLEQLYTPLIGEKLTPKNLIALKAQIPAATQYNFEKFYQERDIKNGQNLIAFHVIQRYIADVLNFDMERSKKAEIRLLGLEMNFKTKIEVNEVKSPVNLRGKLDRLEQVNGIDHILDYKTGVVNTSEIEIIELSDIVSNEKKAKAFQLLSYALMQSEFNSKTDIMAGIIPIRQMSSGIIHFATKIGPRGPKNHIIDQHLLDDFYTQLSSVIRDILNPELPFVEKVSTSF